MDNKYLVQFITLLGAAVASVIMAYRVTTGLTTINYALMIIVIVIIVFFVIGKITQKIMYKIKKDVETKEREEKERLYKEKSEQQQSEENAIPDSDNAEESNEDIK